MWPRQHERLSLVVHQLPVLVLEVEREAVAEVVIEVDIVEDVTGWFAAALVDDHY
jgi:hypothetical protein